MAFLAPVAASAEYQLPKAELQRAVIIEVIDIGDQENTAFPVKNADGTTSPKIDRKVIVTVELVDDLLEKGDKAGMPLLMMKEFTLSMGKKANLRQKLVNVVEGRVMEDDEAAAYDITKLLGKKVMVQVAHGTKRNGETKADIAGFSAVHKSMKIPEAKHPLVLLNLNEFDQKVYDSISPEWKKKKVNLNNVPTHLKPVSEY